MLTIASYNIHRCVGTDFRQNAPRVADVLRELDCDTIGLQEVDNQPGPRSESMQLQFLADALGMRSIAGNTLRRQDGHYGNALLTRRPVLSSRLHDISHAGHEPRGIIDAMLDVDGIAVRIITTHLGLWPAERRAQARLTGRWVQQTLGSGHGARNEGSQLAAHPGTAPAPSGA